MDHYFLTNYKFILIFSLIFGLYLTQKRMIIAFRHHISSSNAQQSIYFLEICKLYSNKLCNLIYTRKDTRSMNGSVLYIESEEVPVQI